LKQEILVVMREAHDFSRVRFTEVAENPSVVRSDVEYVD
jgi:hypothetical protein